jgi:hypothetical protein
MRIVDAFVRHSPNSNTYVIHYRGDGGRMIEVDYHAKDGDENVKLHNAMATTGIIRIQLDDDGRIVAVA